MSTETPQQAPATASDGARVIPLRPVGGAPAPVRREREREPLWRDLVGGVLRRERQAQERTLKEVAETARISMPYLSELERGRKEGSSEVLAAAAAALGLGLGDLLSLAQEDLARQSTRSRLSRGHRAPSARFDGLCLAA
ncbi:transcriptional regulator [Kitasatospora sp. MMS16-BH015]|uniref:helix-turn-helix domain-containing protein n=1 Tax=Kitasatospora sp. MMS16-BH015 TaxID=2018025 RepID=UPI000CA3158A|nr:helix-turn-helix transcriptional regulator [Kitasatospora sp. MMS16-BH015]AUG75502.1 transcriptional regulator [Kitasatospora sp. MMS16-BH015]